MEIKNLYSLDDFEDEIPSIALGLVRLAKNIPHHEFFFHLNSQNEFKFSRVEDLKIIGNFYDYSFPVFKSYSRSMKTCLYMISNRSDEAVSKKPVLELFADESNVNYLLNHYQDVDFIVKASDYNPDFSVILLPETLAFQIQKIEIDSEDELFQTIQYYE